MKILSRSMPARAEPYLQIGAAASVWPEDAAARLAAAIDLYETPEAAAEAAALSVDQLGAQIRGRTAPVFPLVARLADGVGVRLQWIWSGEEPMMRAGHPTAPALAEQVPAAQPSPARPPNEDDGEDIGAAYVILPRDDAEPGIDTEDAFLSDQIVDALAFRADWLEGRLRRDAAGLFLFRVEGDAMEPTLRDGDLALCDRARGGVHDGRAHDGSAIADTIADTGLHALSDGGRIVVRRLQRRIDGGVTLLSDNPLYRPETVPAGEVSRLRILGRVVWHGRTL